MLYCKQLIYILSFYQNAVIKTCPQIVSHVRKSCCKRSRCWGGVSLQKICWRWSIIDLRTFVTRLWTWVTRLRTRVTRLWTRVTRLWTDVACSWRSYKTGLMWIIVSWFDKSTGNAWNNGKKQDFSSASGISTIKDIYIGGQFWPLLGTAIFIQVAGSLAQNWLEA